MFTTADKFTSFIIMSSCRCKGTTRHTKPYAHTTDVINELLSLLRARLIQYILLGIVFMVEEVSNEPVCLDSLPEAPMAREDLKEMCFGSTGDNPLFVFRETLGVHGTMMDGNLWTWSRENYMC